MAYLFIDGSKASQKVLRSKVYNAIKTRIVVVEDGTMSDNISPVAFNVMSFPTLVDKGSRYVGAKAILDYMEKVASKTKPLF